MKNPAWFFTFALLIQVFASSPTARADEYKLAVDMQASAGKFATSTAVQNRAPASKSPVTFYTVGFNPDRPLFSRDGSQENDRAFRLTHPLGFQSQLSGTNFMFSIYALPTNRKYSAPFGDTPSQVNNQSLERGGFAIAYLF